MLIKNYDTRNVNQKPNGRSISKFKYKDLQDILSMIPTEFQSFYQSLEHTDEDEEDEKDYSFCARESSDEEEECQNN